MRQKHLAVLLIIIIIIIKFETTVPAARRFRAGHHRVLSLVEMERWSVELLS